MAADNTSFRIEEIAQRCLALAERRLVYYQELYRSGRWTRFYPTQERFAARLLDAVKAAETFRKVAAQTTVRSLHLSQEQTPDQNRNRTAA